ncbi:MULTISPECIES: MATE family efflux transporter [unclassified Gemella]|uniref:MATE family efflux transporter n=1 Tax=unclassified Gemella TaxID=2624949 RepID=UPI001C54DDEC|nr:MULTISPECIES: MATE family efflux transporter [unclassified Gemella]
MSNFNQKFNIYTLLKSTIPVVAMQIFLALYTIVDGVFVSRLIGTDALGATNIVMPVISVMLALGLMLATGGSAIVAFQLGEGKDDSARQNFSMLTAVTLLISLIFVILGIFFTKDIVILLGASEAQIYHAIKYLKVFLLLAPILFLQVLFSIFLATASKPNIALISTIIAGFTNVILDYYFIVNLNMGIAGAAYATIIGYSIPALIGFLFFFLNKKGLFFVKPIFIKKVLYQASFNGSSEMLTNIANAISTFLFNMMFMKFFADNGVASIAIIMYFQFVLSAIFFGYSLGVAPIISFKYGSRDKKQLKYIINSSLKFVIISGIVIYFIAISSISYVLQVFTEKGSEVYNITISGFYIFALAFILEGVSIFVSAMFTAFSNGRVSLIISFFRSLIFLVLSIILLPTLFGEIGIWLALPTAEFFAIIVSLYFYTTNKKKYGY